MKATINVTMKELDMLENFITCYQICDKHKSCFYDDAELQKIMLKCSDCKKIKQEHYRNALHIWSKLCDAFEKANKIKKGEMKNGR